MVHVVKLLDKLQNTFIEGGLIPKGAYNEATNYSVGDSVDYLGSSYVMFNDANAGTIPTNTSYWQVLANAGVSTVTDTDSIDLTLSNQDIKADLNIQDTNSINLAIDASGLKADLVVQDTNSIDLAIDASGLKAEVLPAGVDHNSLANLTTGDPHTQYLKESDSVADLNDHSHTSLTDIGTTTHADIDTFIGTTVPATYAPLTSPTFATSITGSYLTASEMLVTNASKEVVSAPVATYPSLTELSYVKGVTSAIQTQIGIKAPSTSPTFATSITGSYLTASEILITDGSKNIISAAVATYPSLTELSYIKGLTSAIQTQLGTKLPLAGGTMSGNIVMGDGGTIGQAAGPLIAFDDTNNYLEITGANVGIGTTAPTAYLHLKAGTATASTAPLKFTSGTLLGTAEAGALEFLTDDFFATITTGAARKGIILDNGSRLTSGKIPVATTNGRLIDLTAQANEADLKTDYTAGDLDTEGEIITAFNTTNAKINAILTKLETLGLLAAS